MYTVVYYLAEISDNLPYAFAIQLSIRHHNTEAHDNCTPFCIVKAQRQAKHPYTVMISLGYYGSLL